MSQILQLHRPTLTFDFVDALMEVISAAAQKRVKIKNLRMENNLWMLKRLIYRRNWTKHIGGSRVSTKVSMRLFKNVWFNLFSTRDAVNLTRSVGYHTAGKLVSSSPVMLIFTCEVYKTMVDMTGRKIHLMCWKLLVEASYCRQTTAGFLIRCKQT